MPRSQIRRTISLKELREKQTKIDKCKHCKMDLSIRNPSKFCDHLYYPENCNICQGKQSKIDDIIDKASFGKFVPPEETKQAILQEILKCKPKESKCLHIDFWEKDIRNLFK